MSLLSQIGYLQYALQRQFEVRFMRIFSVNLTRQAERAELDPLLAWFLREFMYTHLCHLFHIYNYVGSALYLKCWRYLCESHHTWPASITIPGAEITPGFPSSWCAWSQVTETTGALLGYQTLYLNPWQCNHYSTKLESKMVCRSETVTSVSSNQYMI